MAAAALTTEALTTEPLTTEPLTAAHRSTHWALLTEAVVAVLVWLGAGARAPLRGMISRCKIELRNERRRRMVRVSCLEGVRRQPTGGGLSAEAMARNARKPSAGMRWHLRRRSRYFGLSSLYQLLPGSFHDSPNWFFYQTANLRTWCGTANVCRGQRGRRRFRGSGWSV